METTITLDQLSPGKRGKILRLLSAGSMKRRLMDIGFTEKTDVQCLYRSAAGDPTAYRVRGTVIALRQEDARQIAIYGT